MIFITAAPLGRYPGCVASSRETNGRQRADQTFCQRHRHELMVFRTHSTGTIISFARAIFSCVRAADSMALGSLLKRRMSLCNDAFARRSDSTFSCIAENCKEALRISP